MDKDYIDFYFWSDTNEAHFKDMLEYQEVNYSKPDIATIRVHDNHKMDWVRETANELGADEDRY